ncbi:nicotinamide-nucleotide amidohydrolase family protein [Arthrobacter sp. Sa2CUA1]|uniref:Nicotinamide-nucleotide amidohydrolase family protein n=1 Tax=Arthrobacter gallicola TaxID=2762225 RepID=A0ABR8UUJ5_9MICC|nr:nicotinamide-nucleotide amidohydrolase family protein [Arthrobacter gallicola]MBD7995901.1 nicotinamide-nucleotide amidohydrolase family protein [Arthrobacter gallicola]
MTGRAPDIVAAAAARGLRVAAAESLTAGMLAAELATVPGASAVLQGGVVAYQNSVKAQVLGVPEDLLRKAGSVDPAVAEQMAGGVRKVLNADIGISTTGVAGPEPHDGKPVGTVFIGIATASAVRAEGFRFEGDRAAIRRQACTAALELLALELLSGEPAQESQG